MQNSLSLCAPFLHLLCISLSPNLYIHHLSLPAPSPHLVGISLSPNLRIHSLSLSLRSISAFSMHLSFSQSLHSFSLSLSLSLCAPSPHLVCISLSPYLHIHLLSLLHLHIQYSSLFLPIFASFSLSLSLSFSLFSSHYIRLRLWHTLAFLSPSSLQIWSLSVSFLPPELVFISLSFSLRLRNASIVIFSSYSVLSSLSLSLVFSLHNFSSIRCSSFSFCWSFDINPYLLDLDVLLRFESFSSSLKFSPSLFVTFSLIFNNHFCYCSSFFLASRSPRRFPSRITVVFWPDPTVNPLPEPTVTYFLSPNAVDFLPLFRYSLILFCLLSLGFRKTRIFRWFISLSCTSLENLRALSGKVASPRFLSFFVSSSSDFSLCRISPLRLPVTPLSIFLSL